MSLLPPNASALEQAQAAVSAQLATLPVRIGDLKRADACPVEWLPWLAWERSVDVWNPAWTESQKRAAIAASFGIHQRKGTAGAVKAALATLDWSSRVAEWHHLSPPGEPYTFSVEITLDRRGIDAGIYDDVERLVLAAKNTRSHLTRISLIHAQSAALQLAGAAVVAETVSVLPYQIGLRSQSAAVVHGHALVTHDITTLYPQVH